MLLLLQEASVFSRSDIKIAVNTRYTFWLKEVCVARRLHWEYVTKCLLKIMFPRIRGEIKHYNCNCIYRLYTVNVENLKITKPNSCNTKMPLVQLQKSLKKKCYEFTMAKVLKPHNMFTQIPKLKSVTCIWTKFKISLLSAKLATKL